MATDDPRPLTAADQLEELHQDVTEVYDALAGQRTAAGAVNDGAAKAAIELQKLLSAVDASGNELWMRDDVTSLMGQHGFHRGPIRCHVHHAYIQAFTSHYDVHWLFWQGRPAVDPAISWRGKELFAGYELRDDLEQSVTATSADLPLERVRINWKFRYAHEQWQSLSVASEAALVASAAALLHDVHQLLVHETAVLEAAARGETPVPPVHEPAPPPKPVRRRTQPKPPPAPRRSPPPPFFKAPITSAPHDGPEALVHSLVTAPRKVVGDTTLVAQMLPGQWGWLDQSDLFAHEDHIYIDAKARTRASKVSGGWDSLTRPSLVMCVARGVYSLVMPSNLKVLPWNGQYDAADALPVHYPSTWNTPQVPARADLALANVPGSVAGPSRQAYQIE